ncbi:putative quinol monooxygenase [Mesorhizobium sp.]|uniref:putative quinol monooxygenase n=1 Tax=Mesorhizobium sp. TaxID=1871066 RepID=UPI000FE84191|nr:putative quinol monooxygenase [Mesorhizobium sp.]RWI36097.1 MAG: antibiotic biosynthesis monooxygenase [Mesorhizobium sp.]
MSIPYTIIGTVVAKPKAREELRQILSGFVEPTRAEEGCINYDFHVDADDPCTFVFYENWRSKADLQRHLVMPHLKPLFDRLEELLAKPIEIKSYVMLSKPGSAIPCPTTPR